ncbi:MAG: hypothetical protein ABIA37_01340 [Candidatus Woesearchaeota archaeon]
MAENISLKNLPKEVKVEVLRELGYDSDGQFVLKDGETFLDRYTEEPVKINNMLILQGSTIIINDDPLSISSYLEDYPNAFK